MNIRIIIVICIAYAMSFIYYTKEIKHVKTIHTEIQFIDSIQSPVSLLGLTLQHKLFSFNVKDYLTDYYFIGNINLIKSIEINKLVFYKKDLFLVKDNSLLLNLDSLNRNNCYKINQELRSNNSKIPYFNKFLNWGGDSSLLLKIIASPLSIAVYILLFLVFFFKKRIIANVTAMLSQKEFDTNNIAWFRNILFFIILFSILLLINPYYFLRDCNYAQFSPVINFSLDGFYTTGSFPTYNPYQFAGVPTLPQSIYALYYPVTHLAYLIAKYIIGNGIYFTTVFIGIHLFVGYIFCIKLLQKVKVNNNLSALLSLSFVFSGAILKMTTTWYYAAPSIAYVPLISFCIWQYYLTSNKKFAYFLSLAFVLFFYSGNVQYATYTFCFVVLFWLIVQSFSAKSFLQLFILGIIILFFYLPQLIISVPIVNQVSRIADSSLNSFKDALDFSIPFVSQINKLFHYNQIILEEDQVNVNFNAISSMVVFMFLLFSFVFYRKIKLAKPILAISILLLIAILFSFGKAGVLWIFFSKLPLFSKFQHPFKFYFFINFFVLILSSIILQKIFFGIKYKRIFNFVILGSSLFSICLTFIFNQKVYNDNYQNPYQLSDDFPKLDVSKYRIAAIHNYDGNNECQTLGLNFPTHYKWPAITGFEDLNKEKPDVIKNANKFSVLYYICTNFENYNRGLTNNTIAENITINKRIMESYKEIFSDKYLRIFEDTSVLPIVQCFKDSFPVNTNYTIKYNNKGANIKFDTNVKTDKIMLAFIWRPHLYIYINNKKYTPIKDEFERLIIFPTEVFEKIDLIYNPFN